jgi:hypothetical protein
MLPGLDIAGDDAVLRAPVNEGLRRKLRLVVASEGQGKTSASLEWACHDSDQRRRPAMTSKSSSRCREEIDEQIMIFLAHIYRSSSIE